MEVIQQKFKDSKIGRIPKDWEVIKLGEACEFYRGQPFAKSEINVNGEYECIHYGQLFTVYSEIIRTIYSKTNSEVIRASERGDILMPSSDVTPTGLATSSVINKGGVLIGGDINIIRPIIKLNSNYLSYLINYEKKKIIRLISGTNVKHIYNRNIKTLLYALPPLPEQQKIAEILSTVDEQISTTQAIIDKSKELKKGLMQKLFSEGIGHTEFKDTKIGRIPKDWEIVKIKDVCSIEYGKDQKKVENPNGKYGIYGTGGLMNYSDKFLYDKPSVLIGRKGTIDKPRYIDVPFWTVDTLFYTKIFNSVDVKWFYYRCVRIPWKTLNEATGVPSLNRNNVYNYKIQLPSLTEQQKIAEILSGADAKIEKEEQEKAQLEQLKKGLMQQLLTGQKRVKA